MAGVRKARRLFLPRRYGDSHIRAFFIFKHLVMTVTNVTPFLFRDHEIRTTSIEGEFFFVGKDICKALSLLDHNRTLLRLDDDERRGCAIVTPSGTQQMVVINESGLYHLIFKSRKQEAKDFRKWVTSEVLPALRRTGRYDIASHSFSSKRQLTLFPDTGWRVEQMRRAAMELALSCSPNSKAAKFLRIVKPLLFSDEL